MRLPKFLTPRPAPTGDAALAEARTRARRRLIGAVVLLGIGIVGFPILFETQPRPIPVDIPIEIPRKETAPPLVAAPPKAQPPAVLESPPDRVMAASVPAVAKAASAVAASAPPPPKPVAEVVPKKDPAPKEPAKEAAKEPPKVAAVAAPAASATASAPLPEGRFVVQVGAYAEEQTLREARQKVEKLGFRTYTQVVETGGAKRTRVRVGPFPTREEAERASARLKAAGMPANILAL